MIQFLMIYAWFPLAVLLAILLMVARFYQNLTGEQTRYALYGLPIILFGLGAAEYARIARASGDPVADLLLALGGGILLWLCVTLYRRMTAGR
jgi:Na+/H+ antiporter NhaC